MEGTPTTFITVRKPNPDSFYISLRTANCECGAPADIYSGHLHMYGKVVLYGWCEECRGPRREEVNGHCSGCFGKWKEEHGLIIELYDTKLADVVVEHAQVL